MNNSIRCFIASLVYSSFLLEVMTKEEKHKDNKEKFEIGDPRRCENTKVGRFEVLPGSGWDNLMNKEMGMAIAVNYSKCKTTDDGLYLIPDSTRAIPLKNSRIDTFAETIENSNEYTSTLSKSINVAAGGSYKGLGLSGKFSAEYQDVKTNQYREESVTMRVQARYVKYRVKLQADSVFDEAFHNRLRKIAAILISNYTEVARYESDLLVRDFGTHVITSMEAGAAIIQVDELSAQYWNSGEYSHSQLRASASANFFRIVNFDSELSSSSSVETATAYNEQRTSSQIMTCGGPVFKPSNFTPNDWVDSIRPNLVALDKSGEPIYNFINYVTLPGVQRSIVYEVYKTVKTSVDNYYEYNTHRGCTDQSMPNFSFQSNIDDGTCNKTVAQFDIGGVFQKCKPSGFINLCKDLKQLNVFTNSFSCPVDFEPILIETNTKIVYRSRRQCSSCWKYFDCCHWEDEEARAEYSAYWCASTRTDLPNRYMFGGLFTSTTDNIITQSNSCPMYHHPFHLLEDLTICLKSIKITDTPILLFGGIFSCRNGNPYADEPKNVTNTGNNKRKITFAVTDNQDTHFSACPVGYSKYIAVDNAGCKVYYCLNAGMLKYLPFPTLQRPPFLPVPVGRISGPLDDDYVISSDGRLWTRAETANEDVPAFMAENRLDLKQFENGNSRTKRSTWGLMNHAQTRRTQISLSEEGIVALSVFATVACILLGSGIVIGIRRSLGERNKRRGDYFGSEDKFANAVVTVQN